MTKETNDSVYLVSRRSTRMIEGHAWLTAAAAARDVTVVMVTSRCCPSCCLPVCARCRLVNCCGIPQHVSIGHHRTVPLLYHWLHANDS